VFFQRHPVLLKNDFDTLGHDYKHALSISVLTAVGVFNRPTFAIYAVVPLFYWFQRGIAQHSQFTPFQTFNFRVAALLPGAFKKQEYKFFKQSFITCFRKTKP